MEADSLLRQHFIDGNETWLFASRNADGFDMCESSTAYSTLVARACRARTPTLMDVIMNPVKRLKAFEFGLQDPGTPVDRRPGNIVNLKHLISSSNAHCHTNHIQSVFAKRENGRLEGALLQHSSGVIKKFNEDFMYQ